MRIVLALGGNALLQRGQALEAELLVKNTQKAAIEIAKVANEHEVLIVHGNGPQVGLLALQADAYKKVKPYPFDILGAESQGMIGYILQQAIGNMLPERMVSTLLTQTIVGSNDPAMQNPSKFIGPVYNQEQSESLAAEHGWNFKQDGAYWRRVVPSPKPQAFRETKAIEVLLQNKAIVIAGGGGGVPCTQEGEKLIGIEAVVDKDFTACSLAEHIKADCLVILTDVANVMSNYGTEQEEILREITPEQLQSMNFAAGSMGPKVEAACQFTQNTGKSAMIGNLFQLAEILKEQAGTIIKTH